MKKKFYIIYMIIGFGAMAFIASMNYKTFSSSASEGGDVSKYVKTSAIVKKVFRSENVFRARKQRMVMVAVTFKTATGKTIESVVSIMKIPFYGIVAKEGDEISVYYNPDEPVKALSFYDKMNLTGGFILFLITGIVIVVVAFIAFRGIIAAKKTAS